MKQHSIEIQLAEIKEHLIKQASLQKDILTLTEAAIYAGISRSFMYKLTSKRQIPFYRPASKLIFFKKAELDSWLLQNRSSTSEEIAASQSKVKGGPR